MSTTRHLINNRRRRLATAAQAAPAQVAEPQQGTRKQTPRPAGEGRRPDRPDGGSSGEPSGNPPRRSVRLPAVLCVLTVLLGGFAAYAGAQASALREAPAARNAALTDIARTSEVKGQIAKAVEAVFSYDFADPGALDRAVTAHLTGKAAKQHGELLAAVRGQGPEQKLVLTTTVTESGVELIDGDRARMLVFADQSSTRTAAKDETTYAGAMLAVDAVRADGTWRIAAIDTLGAGS
ncbi:hypothetical protein AB0M39_32640 [Streptomyces sp. NPDC051907]|uniref:hypothetical protein n=1 Tax=Streptomyces sp. NPDC051907 TaxID=3155284 RepID=UPI003437AE4F